MWTTVLYYETPPVTRILNRSTVLNYCITILILLTASVSYFSCAEDIKGANYHGYCQSARQCLLDESGLPEEGCKFCVDERANIAKGSIMGKPEISSVSIYKVTSCNSFLSYTGISPDWQLMDWARLNVSVKQVNCYKILELALVIWRTLASVSIAFIWFEGGWILWRWE